MSPEDPGRTSEGRKSPAHYSVMGAEALELLEVTPDGVFLDATTGLGGHTGQIASRLSRGFVIGCDRDSQSLGMARQALAGFGDRVELYQARFSELRAVVEASGKGRVDGLLADLGVSRYQLTTAERGFSILADGPLDMRMDQSQGTTAADIVNYSAEKAIADLLYEFGEERGARKLARAIVRARPIRSTRHLADVVERAARRTSHLHPATKTFMALRIAVNQEFDEIDRLLDAAPDILKPDGRMVVISFTSAEDRRIKERFREWKQQRVATVLTKRPLQPGEDEVRANPPSRSAKLRAVRMGIGTE